MSHHQQQKIPHHLQVLKIIQSARMFLEKNNLYLAIINLADCNFLIHDMFDELDYIIFQFVSSSVLYLPN